MSLAIALVVAAYLVGSISFAVVVARRRGVDLRAIGSGNLGATNVGRALGRRAGWTVLVLDALKGAAPVVLARAVLHDEPRAVAAVALAAVVGHCFPIWHRLRGGKGAATGGGALIAAVPVAGAAAFMTFFVLKRISRRASVGSLGGGLAGAIVTIALDGTSALAGMALASLGLVLLRHADNVERLLRGEEPPS